MSNYSFELDETIVELDSAVETHMDWMRRVLRCAVLRTPPGEDVLLPESHKHCHFGRWLESKKAEFEKIDTQDAHLLEAAHLGMHNAIRGICLDLLAGRAGQSAQVEAFERHQSQLIKLLSKFKTLLLSDALKHDPLTGLPLRHGIEEEFIRSKKNARRNGFLFYTVMIDVDRFKKINDLYGHPVGDTVLRHLADTLRSSVRANEPLFRFGGEEFLLFLQCKTQEEAGLAAQRLLNAVRSARAPIHPERSLTLTVTMGLARVHEHETVSRAIERADAALYAGKRAGRDRYVIAAD